MLSIVKNIIKDIIDKKYFVYKDKIDINKSVNFIENNMFGDVSCNLAMILAKDLAINPKQLAQEICNIISASEQSINFKKIEVAGSGFINFSFSDDYLRSLILDKNNNIENILNNIKNTDILKLKNQTVLVEYTDPNPFKAFHIGHLMTNIIGEAIANIYELSGANVKRINYQGDVGRHIAITVFSILQDHNYTKFLKFKDDIDHKIYSIKEKVLWLGEMYTYGYNFFKDAEENLKTNSNDTKSIEILDNIANINKRIYQRSDIKTNDIYDFGKNWSLEYFEILYNMLGTKFDKYIMESEAAPIGLNIVKDNMDRLFVKGQDNAVINKDFSNGLHTRVFINKNGLPTYEAKDLGNMYLKLKYYPDTKESVIITANEVNDYFKLINYCITDIYPDLQNKLKHFGHGMMRFAEGKMSSRKGNIITGDSLIEEIKNTLEDKFTNSRIENEEEKVFILEKVAVSAIKYAILKQSIGKDIIFDISKVVSVEGDSGPYLQYTFARLCAVTDNFDINNSFYNISISDNNREIIINILKIEDILLDIVSDIAPQKLTSYIIELSRSSNSWYSNNRIIDDMSNQYLAHRVKDNLKIGMQILGIYPTSKM